MEDLFDPIDLPRTQVRVAKEVDVAAHVQIRDGKPVEIAAYARKDRAQSATLLRNMVAQFYKTGIGEGLGESDLLGDILEERVNLTYGERARVKEQIAQELDMRSQWSKEEREALTDLLQLHRADVLREYGIAGALIEVWSRTSGDHDPVAVAMQMAARAEFSLQADVAHFKDLVHPAPEVARAREGLRSFLRAQYEFTQERLREMGVEEVVVSRGVSLESHDLKGGWGEGTLGLQPLSSFSLLPAVAWDGFARNDPEGIFVITKVPRSRVFSLPLTGFGSLPEAEVVLLGGRLTGRTFNHQGDVLPQAWRNGIARIYGVRNDYPGGNG